MTEIPFPVFDLSADEINIFLKTYDKLKSKYKVENDENFSVDLNAFELLKNINDAAFKQVFKVEYAGSDFHLLFISSTWGQYNFHQVRRSYLKEYQPWAIATLNRDFGHVCIARETVQHKLLELFSPMELDFEDDKKFSNKFYVLAKDKIKAELAITQSFRDVLLECFMDDMFLEIKDYTLIAHITNCVEAGITYNLAEFVRKLIVLR